MGFKINVATSMICVLLICIRDMRFTAWYVAVAGKFIVVPTYKRVHEGV